MKKLLTLLIVLIIQPTLIFAESTIYLVRHAEKDLTQGIKNPELTPIGKFRAQNIAKQLSKVGITAIYSTNYNRTMQTARPLADFLNLSIQPYDARKLVEFAKEVKSMDGNILIVGHSNTTPKLTSLISGQTVKPINENEYDNVYQVIVSDSQTILNRFKSIPSYELNPNIGKTKNIIKTLPLESVNEH